MTYKNIEYETYLKKFRIRSYEIRPTVFIIPKNSYF